MLMFAKEFDSYDKMIKYLSKVNGLTKASFEFRKGLWVLSLVWLDREPPTKPKPSENLGDIY